MRGCGGAPAPTPLEHARWLPPSTLWPAPLKLALPRGPYLVPPNRYVRYVVRRFLRLWPALAVALGVHALASGTTLAGEPSDCPADWWKVLLMLNDVLPTGCMYGMTW